MKGSFSSTLFLALLCVGANASAQEVAIRYGQVLSVTKQEPKKGIFSNRTVRNVAANIGFKAASRAGADYEVAATAGNVAQDVAVSMTNADAKSAALVLIRVDGGQEVAFTSTWHEINGVKNISAGSRVRLIGTGKSMNVELAN